MTETQSTGTRWRYIILTIAGVIIILALMQVPRFIIPEFKLDNPPSTNTVAWDSAETEQLWRQTCADCHSNETVYPWYAYVAPVGWLVAHDTHEGREALNVSDSRRFEWDEMVEKIREGEMPPSIYTVIHPEARLSDADQQALISGLRQTFGAN